MFRLRFGIGFALLLLSSVPLLAQGEMPGPVSKTYAITNARVIPRPGQTLERTTVLIREGSVVSVGRNITLPYDAQVIEGDSLWVYAGFIDGLSNTGIPQPTQTTLPEKIADPSNPSYERTGTTPQKQAVMVVSGTEKSIETMRNLGFTLAHVVPNGEIMPGQGALIFLGGTDAGSMTYHPRVSMFGQLTGAARGAGQSVYPSNILGVMAYWRELFYDAHTLHRRNKAWTAAPTSGPKPDFSAELEAMRPVLDKLMPVFIPTGDIRTLRRAKALADELQFGLVAAGLGDPTGYESFFASNTVPLMLTLDLPEDKNKVDSDSTLGGMAEVKRTNSFADTEHEATQLKIRTYEALKARWGAPAALRSAGVTFGFSSLNVKATDIRGNLQKMIANGLSEDHALAALTTDAAAILGISDRFGTIEAGKAANLVITDGNYFEKGTNVTFVFVDGIKYAAEKTTPASPGTTGRR